MEIVVIGSTGGTGLEVVKQGIQRGHMISTLERHPEKLNGISGIASVVKGDALNSGDVRSAIAGQDAVISVLGDPEPARNILAAMNEERIRRAIWVSAWPIAGKKPWILIKFSWLMFGKHYKMLAEMEQIVSKSDIDWTIVRPPRLTNAKKSGNVRILRDDNLPSGPYSISRADLAAILLDEAESSMNVRTAKVVTSGAKNTKQIQSASIVK